MPLMHSANLIAKYFLALPDADDAKDLISNLELQKHLYYAQGYHLAEFDEPLFHESIEAWKHGPVIPSVYQSYSHYGSAGIPKPDQFDCNLLAEPVRNLLDRVYRAYGQYSAWKLRQMTHEEPPWLIAWAEQRSVISVESIRLFFKSRLVSKPQPAATEVESRIHSYVTESLSAFGQRRENVRANLVRLIRVSNSQARYADFATKLILTNEMPGRIDEALEVLVASGPHTVRALFSETLPFMPPNEDNVDYWYVLIRALGVSGACGEVAQFIKSPYVKIREAAVEALNDLADEYSLDLLKRLEETDSSKFIKRLASELIQERNNNVES